MKTIQNNYLIAEINEKGAELFSLRSKDSNTEYLWQGNAEYWAGRAPTLFPVCGRLSDGKYIYKGKEYQMNIHGFARACEFHPTVIADNEIEFVLVADDNTKKIYPFDFKLSIKFKLEDNKLIKTIKVTNTGNETMPFSFGGHPGFNVPVFDNEKFDDYYIEFSKSSLNKMIFSDRYLYTPKTEPFTLDENRLFLRHDLFDNDALFFEIDDGWVKLKSKKSDFELEMSFNDMTCVGLWHKPKSDAPYVCIEPWHGVPAEDGIVDDLQTKKHMIHLKANDTYENTCQVKISK